MAKRIALGLLLSAVLGGVLAAQEASTAKAAVGLDLFPLVKGIIWSNSDADDTLFALAVGYHEELEFRGRH
jgi:hypothetical protein